MLSAIVLLTTERDKTNKVAQALADAEGVSEVYSVAGRYDLAAIVRVKDNDALAEVVTEHIRNIQGITSSETLIAFRVYSRHDLERMFSIGMDGRRGKERTQLFPLYFLARISTFVSFNPISSYDWMEWSLTPNSL